MSSSQPGPIPGPLAQGLDPPAGKTPAYYEAFTLRPYQTLEIAACITITTVLLIGRVYTKLALIKKVTWEDYSAIVGWAAFVAFCALNDTLSKHGGGTHQWNLHYEDVQFIKRYENYGDMVYSVSLLSTKLSLMLLILRVFCSVHYDIPYYLTCSLMIINSAFYLCYIIVPAALCKPRQKIWTPELPGKCLDANKLYLASAIFNFMSDLAMLSVPVFLIWRLQMSLRRKMGITIIFCTGGLACIASVIRIVWTTFLLRTDDYTYSHFATSMWSAAEIAFGLFCTNLVILPRLYQQLCDLTPYATTPNQRALNGQTEVERAKQHNDGRSKREWMQLEERAAKDQQVFGNKARLGDEEAVDTTLDDGDVRT